jgi:serine/threonine protein kinase
MSLPPGTRLGPYEILSRLGGGGMGEVFSARDTRLDRTVALKTLRADVAASADLRVRFEREARAIASITHPHICTLYDVGRARRQGPRTFADIRVAIWDRANQGSAFAIAPAGDRLLVSSATEVTRPITIVLNWTAMLGAN